MTASAYPEYRESGIEWVGLVPSHWKVSALAHLVREVEEPNSDLRERNRLSLSYGAIIERDIESADGLLPTSFDTYNVIQPHDIVLRLTDLQNDRRSLRSALCKFKGIVTSAYTSIRPHGIQSTYLAYLLHSYDLTKVFYGMGGGLRQTLKFSDMKYLPVLLPTCDEQFAIAAFIDRETGKIDALVAEQERLIALLKEKRQAVISHAVTKGLNPDAPVKDSGVLWLGEVPTCWIVTRVKTCATLITSGPRGWSDRISEEGVLFIQSGDLDDDLRVQVTTAKRVNVDVDAEALRSRLQDGDVVVCITGAKTGNVGLFYGKGVEAYINQHLSLIRPNKEILSRFLSYILKGVPGQLHFDTSQYGLKQGLSLQDVESVPIALPPLVEQDEIVAVLDEQITRLDVLQFESTRAISLLRERRAALISAAVTGKIDVRDTIAQPSSQAA